MCGAPVGGYKQPNAGQRKNKDNYPYPTLGKAIKDKREATGRSQDFASRILSVGVNTLSGAERGYKWVSKEVYIKLCRHYKLNFRELISIDLKREEESSNE